MRSLVILLLAALPVLAAPRTGVVKVEKAQVRNGASDKFDVTNELPRDTQVEILEELPGGWLKIRPPARSFSWVNMTFLDRSRPDGIYVFAPLKAMTAPVYPGSEIIRDRRPNIVGTRLKVGELVVARGEPMQGADDGYWLPIEPPASEVRYLHASALDIKTGTTVAQVSATAPGDGPKGPLPAPKYPSANQAKTPEEEWREAALAEYQGLHQAAIQMYDALAKRTQTSHPHIAEGALRRADALRLKMAPLPAVPPTGKAPTGSVSSSTPRPLPEAGVADGRSTLSGEKPRPGTYKARLSRAGWAIDRRPTYRIEVLLNGTYTEAGYAISGNPSLNLEPWVGQEVEVAGSIWYHGMARRNVITVTSVRAQPR